MIILAVKRGYLQIDEISKEIIEYDNGLDYDLTVNGNETTVKIIPVGSIVIDSYNQNVEKYKAAGGSVSELLRIHKSNKIQLAADPKENKPTVPPWIYPRRKQDDYSLGFETDFDLPFLSVAFVPFQGDRVPLFSVTTVNDLYFYDMYRMKAANMQVRECEECGKAFIGNTTATCCSKTCINRRNNRKRSERLEKQPESGVMYQIKNTVRRRRLSIKQDSEFWAQYYNNLCNYMNTHTAKLSKESEHDFFISLKRIDLNFSDLNNYINCRSFDGSINDQKQWKTERLSIYDQKDPEKWLRSWFERLGREWK